MIHQPQPRLYVSNLVQKVLFLAELQGQISDGNWENARPHDHYKPWSALRWDSVTIARDPADCGRTFWAQKDNYALGSRDLMDIVGDRMLLKARMALLAPDAVSAVLAHDTHGLPEDRAEFVALRNAVINGTAQPFYQERMLRLAAAGITEETYFHTETVPYSMRDMLKDLRALSAAMRNQHTYQRAHDLEAFYVVPDLSDEVAA